MPRASIPSAAPSPPRRPAVASAARWLGSASLECTVRCLASPKRRPSGKRRSGERNESRPAPMASRTAARVTSTAEELALAVPTANAASTVMTAPEHCASKGRAKHARQPGSVASKATGHHAPAARLWKVGQTSAPKATQRVRRSRAASCVQPARFASVQCQEATTAPSTAAHPSLGSQRREAGPDRVGEAEPQAVAFSGLIQERRMRPSGLRNVTVRSPIGEEPSSSICSYLPTIRRRTVVTSSPGPPASWLTKAKGYSTPSLHRGEPAGSQGTAPTTR